MASNGTVAAELMPADAWSAESTSDTFSSGEDVHEDHAHVDESCACQEDFDYELERSIRERMQSRPGGAMIASYQEAIPNYVTVDGLPLPGALITKTFDKIKTFEARPDDVIIAGYPRSGKQFITVRSRYSTISFLQFTHTEGSP